MATNSSILAWENPRTEELGGLHSMESQESDMIERLNNNCIILHIQNMFNTRTTIVCLI